MDIDAFVAAHAPTWQRLERLVSRARRPRRCSGAELDELVDLYQRTATHLSVIRTASPDPLLVGKLSSLVARARGVVAGARVTSWREVTRFLAVTFPAAVWRLRYWVLGVAATFLAIAFALGIWVASSPSVQGALAPPEAVQDLVRNQFEGYYHSAPAASFAFRVFTNNVGVAAAAFAFGILIVPTVVILIQNAAGIGITGGFMASAGAGPLFFGLVLPHGLLELTAIFVAGAAGLRIGWVVVDPGDRRRRDALAEEGRAATAVVIGLVLVFLVAGLTEAFVTPSGLPTWARVAWGVTIETAFIVAVVLLGRRAVAAGETGDLLALLRGDRDLTV